LVPTNISTSTTPKDVARAVRGAELVGLDLETTGLDPRRAEIRLIQIATSDETFVIDCQRRDKEDLLPVVEALGAAPVVAHNAAFEWSFIYYHFGVELMNITDTMLLAQLLAAGNMGVERGLGPVAKDVIDVDLDKDQQTSDWSTPVLTKAQLDYAAFDAQVLLPLYEKLSAAIAEAGLQRVARIENEALPAVARMKLEGMPVDKAAWDAHTTKVEAELKALERRMLEAEWMPIRPPVPQQWKLTGPDCKAMLEASGITGLAGTTAKDLKPYEDHEVVKRLLAYRKAKGDERENLKAAILEHAPEKPPAPPPPWNFGSPQQVKELCYAITGEWFENTDEVTLLQWVDKHPFFGLLLEHRKLAKRARTYGPEWFKDAYDEDHGRVYPGWRQIGASTGRFACSTPNAQNLPNDGPYRSFFKATAGRTFVDVDYSQIEVRICAKMLEETSLLELFERGEDIYKSTAAKMLDVDEEAVTKKQRDLAKAMILGLLYGLSAYGLPTYAFKNYGIKMTPREAGEYVQTFYGLYPKLEEYHESILEELNEQGYVNQKTLSGRRRDNITNRNEAINAPVQGTAADGLKMAMAEVYKGLRKFDGTAFIVATIHDEFLVECDEADGPEVLEIVQRAMVETMDTLVNAEEPHVPIEVEGTVTKVWSKA
jgi:DNA polymerase I